jgi:hypothetical protein
MAMRPAFPAMILMRQANTSGPGDENHEIRPAANFIIPR